ncbi:hypothetical protein [Stenotrophomonas mori]|uniref:ATP-dependent Clp protease proteolytic subunit n=1 Tax=Stenotrophomonas mori TaxID=2871096 RepID=A0ABT0SK78_9GAMM|nr:hypothetical protein [Stenotrophomonas mori]MCL7715733.1 hypothetical protein [Stenotrophomonas mori]
MPDRQQHAATGVARRPRPARRGSAGATLGKFAVAAAGLLLLAHFIGRRTASVAPVPVAAVAAPAMPVAPPTGPRVVRGEKSTVPAAISEARMTLLAQEGVLRVEGSVGRDFARDLQAQLDAAPSLRRIDITSGGGYATPGLEAARIVHRNNLTVRVRGYCASICVALWAAAAQRQLAADAVIGLHQRDAQCEVLPSPAREECRYQDRFATEHNASYRAWLQAAGFNRRLLDLQARTAAEDLAVLSALQLWENGVDFSAVDEDGNRMSRLQVERHLAGASGSR